MLLTVYILFAASSCAQQNTGIAEDRIIQGVPIPIDEVPWAASYGGFNTAVIIHKRWALTTARHDRHDFIKIKGETLNFGDGEIIFIETEFPHPQYSSTYDYNFSLLKLTRDIKFDKNAKAIDIGDVSMISIKTEVTIVGWGALNKNGKRSSLLMAFSGPITMCKKKNLPFPSFCTGIEPKKNGQIKGDGKGPCIGDEGSPATIGDKLIGIVGEAGCGTNQTDFMIVPLVKEWIWETIKNQTEV